MIKEKMIQKNIQKYILVAIAMIALMVYIVPLDQLNDAAFARPGPSSESEEEQDNEVLNEVEVEEEQDQGLTGDKNERDDNGKEINEDLEASKQGDEDDDDQGEDDDDNDRGKGKPNKPPGCKNPHNEYGCTSTNDSD